MIFTFIFLFKVNLKGCNSESDFIIYYYMKKSSAIFLILSSFIGAGFVTGKELFVFYARFGFVGVLNIILTMAILYMVIKFYLDGQNCSYVFKGDGAKYGNIVKILFIICYFIVCSALFAGIKEMVGVLNIKPKLGFVLIIFTLLLVFLLSLGDVNVLSKVSSILVPIIMLFYIVVCIYGIVKVGGKINNYIYSKNVLLSVCSSFNYVGINTILSLMLFKEIGANCKQNKGIAIWCSLIFGVLMFLGVYALMCCNVDMVIEEMPLLVLATSISKVLGWGYIISMWLAILTSILTIIYTIKCRLKNIINNNIFLTAVVIVPCFILSFIGFGNLIEYLYPVIGAVGVAYFMVFKMKINKRTVEF